MNFLSPAAFWFAAALPAVVVFYLLKKKRVVRVVPSTVLWRRFLAETQASAPFQKLRHNWLLILQLLMLLLAVLALARPYFKGQVKQGSRQVVILDTSASMQATDEKPTRMDVAKARAIELVNGLSRGAEMIVLSAGANAQVRQSPTTDKAALRRAIEAITATDSPTRMLEALRVAETLTRDQPGSEVHLFSDGVVGDLSEFALKAVPLTFHRVGKSAANVGIVTLDVKANPEDPTRRAVFVSLVNQGDAPVNAQVELRFNDELKEVKPVNIGPTNMVQAVFVSTQETNGVFQVRLIHTDDLAADNEANMVSLLPLPLKVLVVTKGNRLLTKAISSAGERVEVSVAADFTDVSAPYDLVVLDDVVPKVWPAQNVLAIHVGNTNWFPGGIGELPTPTVMNWKNTHPLLRFVTFDNVPIVNALAVQTPGWGTALVEAAENPLIVAGELGRQRIVWVGFDTLMSQWPLRISFPIFMANAVAWLNPQAVQTELFQVRAGDAWRFPLAEPVSRGNIRMPDGASREFTVDPQAREWVFGETGRRGVYSVELGTNRVQFASNLLDAEESNIRPRDVLSMGPRAEVAASVTKRASLEHWRWFALTALAVLMGEWWWFHRRTA